MEIILIILLDFIINAAILWIAGKVVVEDLTFRNAFIVSASTAIIGIIPKIGWLLSIVVFFYLLKKFTRSNIWPNLIMLALIRAAIVALLMVQFEL